MERALCNRANAQNFNRDFNPPKLAVSLLKLFNYKSLCQKCQTIQFSLCIYEFELFLLKYI